VSRSAAWNQEISFERVVQHHVHEHRDPARRAPDDEALGRRR
jgi:hypothetical protein